MAHLDSFNDPLIFTNNKSIFHTDIKAGFSEKLFSRNFIILPPFPKSNGLLLVVQKLAKLASQLE